MVKSKTSMTGSFAAAAQSRAEELKARIADLTARIDEIDATAERSREARIEAYISASSFKGMSAGKESQVREWARIAGDEQWAEEVEFSGRGQLVTERMKLRRELDGLLRGQLSLL